LNEGLVARLEFAVGDGRQPVWPLPQERFHVRLLVVGNRIFPTTIDDSDPPIGKGADCHVMPLTFRFLVVIIGTSPVAVRDRLSGKLMEALFDKLGAGKATMHPLGFSAALGNRCNAGVLRHFPGGVEAAPVGSHRHQQVGHQDGASPRKAAKDLRIRMFLKCVLDPSVEMRESNNQRT